MPRLRSFRQTRKASLLLVLSRRELTEQDSRRHGDSLRREEYVRVQKPMLVVSTISARARVNGMSLMLSSGGPLQTANEDAVAQRWPS